MSQTLISFIFPAAKLSVVPEPTGRRNKTDNLGLPNLADHLAANLLLASFAIAHQSPTGAND